MTRIRFAFHNGNDSLLGKAIIGWTWFLGLFYNWSVLKFNYSHVEIWMPDRVRGFYDWDGTKVIYCISSASRDDEFPGVRSKHASKVLKHPDRWDYIEAEADDERVEVALAEANKLMGKGYDYLGIFGFFNPFAVQDKNRWYCSELASWFCYLTRITKKRHERISPRRLAYELSKRYGEPKPV